MPLNAGTFAILNRSVATNDFRTIFDTDDARHAFFHNTTAVPFGVYNDGYQTDFTAFVRRAQWEVIGVEYEKASLTQRVYQDGRSVPASGTSGTWGSTAVGTYLHIGERFTETDYINADVQWAALWSRPIGPDNQMLLHQGVHPTRVARQWLVECWDVSEFVRTNGLGQVQGTILLPNFNDLNGRVWANPAPAHLYAPPSVRRDFYTALETSLVTARPSGTASAGTWTPVGAASLHAAVNDQSDTTLARSSTGAGSDTMDLTFPAMGTPGAGTVTFYIRHRRTP